MLYEFASTKGKKCIANSCSSFFGTQYTVLFNWGRNVSQPKCHSHREVLRPTCTRKQDVQTELSQELSCLDNVWISKYQQSHANDKILNKNFISRSLTDKTLLDTVYETTCSELHFYLLASILVIRSTYWTSPNIFFHFL